MPMNPMSNARRLPYPPPGGVIRPEAERGPYWTLEEAAAYLGWPVREVPLRITDFEPIPLRLRGKARLRTRTVTQSRQDVLRPPGHSTGHLVGAPGEPHQRSEVRYVTRVSVIRYAQLLAGDEA